MTKKKSPHNVSNNNNSNNNSNNPNSADNPNNPANSHDLGDYLENTPIYYGATVALQARHGGYLSYSSGDVKASAHKILAYTRFIIKKSDDLTDIGSVKYGDALWLQTIANTSSAVLGAVYGSLKDKKREIQPALVSCKRSAMFKAQQYGRWIVLNRDHPVTTLGEVVGHLDKIILEQEWCFLASNAPGASSMYRIAENSDDALARQIDLFRPGDECVWRVHLVALPSDEADDEKIRQQRLQLAKDQIDQSETLRLTKAKSLLGSLAGTLPDHLRDENYLAEKLQHKRNIQSEQEYLRALYEEMAARDFLPPSQSVGFLSGVYGSRHRIVQYRRAAIDLAYQREAVSESALHRHHQSRLGNSKNSSSGRGGGGSGEDTSSVVHVERMMSACEIAYWDVAQKLLVQSQSWDLLPRAMAEFSDKDRKRKQEAARIIQVIIIIVIIIIIMYSIAVEYII
jgi:hypothetical protein